MLYVKYVRAEAAGSYHGGLNGLYSFAVSWTTSIEPPIHLEVVRPFLGHKSNCFFAWILDVSGVFLPILVTEL